MVRPRLFEPDTVRERVADVFAAHGYQGTSMSMLTEAASLGKQSLYNAFGDKQQLYLDAVECAAARFSVMEEQMQRAPSGRAAVDVFFAGLLRACTHPDPAQHACIVSAGLLEGIADPAIARKLREKWDATLAVLRATVKRGQVDNSIRIDIKSDDLARMLMTLMSGLRISARATDDERQLKTTIGLVLQVLAPPT